MTVTQCYFPPRTNSTHARQGTRGRRGRSIKHGSPEDNLGERGTPPARRRCAGNHDGRLRRPGPGLARHLRQRRDRPHERQGARGAAGQDRLGGVARHARHPDRARVPAGGRGAGARTVRVPVPWAAPCLDGDTRLPDRGRPERLLPGHHGAEGGGRAPAGVPAGRAGERHGGPAAAVRRHRSLALAPDALRRTAVAVGLLPRRFPRPGPCRCPSGGLLRGARLRPDRRGR